MSQLLSKFLTILATDPVVQQAISANSGNPNALTAYLMSGGTTSAGQQKFDPLTDADAVFVVAAQGKSVDSKEYNDLVDQIKNGFCTAWSVHFVTIDGRTFTLNETIDPPPSSLYAARIVIDVENAGP